MKRTERQWMYERLDGGVLSEDFVKGVDGFVEYAKRQKVSEECSKLRCPCLKCENTKFHVIDDVKLHLYKKGFMKDYFEWTSHGEEFLDIESHPVNSSNTFRDMVYDGLHSSVIDSLEEAEGGDDEPNPKAKRFFEMLRAAEEPLFEGSKLTLLEMASRLMNLKCEFNLTHRCVDSFASLFQDAIPEGNLMTKTFYETKKVLKALELPHQKIHACPKGCILFWKTNASLDTCYKCGAERYKDSASGKRLPSNVLTYFPLTPRLQRLYATKDVAECMSWHSKNPRVRGILAHPSDAEAWKNFDATFPDFADEPRNVRLGLCTDGFAPYGNFGSSYSCWPVIVTPYNLPPWLCMKRQFMFLSLLIPGPKNPKGNLDVYLQPLIEELKELWEVGATTYDVSTRKNFQMRAALMWTISDFPAYGMLSGWSTAGKYACPYCMTQTKSFWLKFGRKFSWFDCHRQFLPCNHLFRKNKNKFFKNRIETHTPPPRLTGQEVWQSVSNLPKVTDSNFLDWKGKEKGWSKQSIFWELPYWKSLLIRHNLDVMHIEKNFFDQLINTIMDVKGRTLDTLSTRKDLPTCCKRRNLEVIENNGRETLPKAQYTLDKAQKKVLCEWVQKLKFPDNYASNLSRCVDVKAHRLYGLKSHDCHVFMERLVPVAFRHLLPTNVWKSVTEISQFFRDLCTSTIHVHDMIRLEDTISEILCKLEIIFHPSFFNSMEHLPIHLPYEAKTGGPVQYRWMYPFERFLNHLKRKIGNKARVEESICNAYLMEEISNFCVSYFDRHIDTKSKDAARNACTDIGDELNSTLPELFQYNIESLKTSTLSRYLGDKEYLLAHLYVLSNCGKLEEYERMFEEHIIQIHPNIDPSSIWNKYDEEYPAWFKEYVDKLNVKDDVIQALAMGPSKEVRTWRHYCVNGFKFHTYEYGKNKTTMNYGVCVKTVDEVEYYGILTEIVELSYCGEKGSYDTILFKCDWIDPTNGVKTHDQYKLVEVNLAKKYPKYDPFILAHQAQQVYYASYPTLKNDRNQWLAVFKTQARSNIDAPVDTSIFQEEVIQSPPSLSPFDISNDDDMELEDNVGEEEENYEDIHEEEDVDENEEDNIEEVEEDYYDNFDDEEDDEDDEDVEDYI